MAVLSQRRRRAVVLLALATVFVITLDMGGGRWASTVRGIASGLFSPVERVMRVVTRPIGDVWRAVGEYDALIEENRLLREKVAQQEGAAVAAAASVRLSQELLALNGLPTLAGINSVSAQVIGEAPSNFSATVEINQGSDSGIRVGMPVLNAAGLIGRITRVERERAVIRRTRTTSSRSGRSCPTRRRPRRRFRSRWRPSPSRASPRARRSPPRPCRR
jgi:rod shape-determining protein MreC